MADDHSAQIDGALRFGAHRDGAAATMYGVDPLPPPHHQQNQPQQQQQRMYFHTESTAPTEFHQQPYDMSTLGTPHSSVRVTPYGGEQQSAAKTDKEGGATKMSKPMRIALTIGALLLLMAIGIGLVVLFTRDASEPNTDHKSFYSGAASAFGRPSDAAATHSVSETQHPFMPASASAPLPIDEFGGFDIDSAPDGQQEATTYYYPSPMATPGSTPRSTPIPHEQFDQTHLQQPQSPPQPQPQPQQPIVTRGSAGDGKPPPGSWFGADAPTRGEAAAEMSLDGEFGNQAAMSKIYGGNANSVLGGKNKPPFATVNDDAARQIGWAEMGDPGVPESGQIDANQIATGSARSMSELYQAGMEGKQFRQGSSASTFVTPEQAAAAAIGNSPDRTQQFAAGRERAKAITAESSAAIGSIYDKKRKAAAGLSAAAVAQQNQYNDPNFEYYDVQSQRPI